MLELKPPRSTVDLARFHVSVASTAQAVEEAQRLRWRVFVEEQGARPLPGADGIEADRFDQHCCHLLVRDLSNGRLVGTYRILTPERARAAGGYYTEQEFDLAPLAAERDGLVEIGRSCVHPDYRSGMVISLLWSGLASVLLETNARWVIGCASIPLGADGLEAARLYHHLCRAGTRCRAFDLAPYHPLPLNGPAIDAAGPIPRLPPLIKGYLRAGAVVAGAPAMDVAFGTADLPMLLPLDQLTPRYARRFVEATACA